MIKHKFVFIFAISKFSSEVKLINSLVSYKTMEQNIQCS